MQQSKAPGENSCEPRCAILLFLFLGFPFFTDYKINPWVCLVEISNSALKKLRHLNILHMLHGVYMREAEKLYIRHRDAMEMLERAGGNGSHPTKRVREKIKEQVEQIHKYRFVQISVALFQVTHNVTGIMYQVDIDRKLCSCREWQIFGYPCRHLCRVLLRPGGNQDPNRCIETFMTIQGYVG